MNNKPRETLCTIIRDYGRDVARDTKRCKALLLDMCGGEHKREINILVSAMEERIASDLLTPQPNIPHGIWLPQLAKRLHDNTGIATEFAQWAVESWALALGVIQEHDLAGVKVRIEGGTFVIGNPKEKAMYNDEINSKPVTVATFEIARYPITNAQYKLFMDDGGYNPNRSWWDKAGREWLQEEKVKEPRFWYDGLLGRARVDHPVVGVTWYESVAYCRWLTQKLNDRYIYRLPTEAEWEYAARRNTGRTYPWGNEEPDGERANYNRNHESTTAVGSFPKGATPDGIYDMAGNVWEWTGSIYKPYPYDPRDGREDLSNPASSDFVLRGGGWGDRSDALRSSRRVVRPTPPLLRRVVRPNPPLLNIGFRLARHLP